MEKKEENDGEDCAREEVDDEEDDDEVFHEIYEEICGELEIDFRAKFQREPTDDELDAIRQNAERLAEDAINEVSDDDEKEIAEDLTSPLIAAAKIGMLATVRTLLETGADKNETTNLGRTAMWHAAQNGHVEVVRLLIEHGADKDKADMDQTYFGKETPLFTASRNGHLAVVRLLISEGADMEKTNAVDWSPLYVATFGGHVDVVHYLLEQGANKDKTLNHCGMTPLHLAANLGYVTIATQLMACGADLNARDKNGEMPIDMARTEEIKQAIHEESKRRIDEGHKKLTEEDGHEEQKDVKSNKRPRID